MDGQTGMPDLKESVLTTRSHTSPLKSQDEWMKEIAIYVCWPLNAAELPK